MLLQPGLAHLTEIICWLQGKFDKIRDTHSKPISPVRNNIYLYKCVHSNLNRQNDEHVFTRLELTTRQLWCQSNKGFTL